LIFDEILPYVISELKSKGIDKVHATTSISEKKELNIDAGKISLLRTTFQNSIFIEGIKDNKQASISGNKTSRNEIDTLINKLIESIRISKSDKSNDIAKFQIAESFQKGELRPDLKNMYEKLNSFNEHVISKHKYIKLEQAILDHTHSKSKIMNSNGIDFTVKRGEYGFSPMFTAKKGSLTSSFNYTSYSALDLTDNIKDRGYVDELMKQSVKQLHSKKNKTKFVGKVIVTPHCLPDFISFVENSISDGALISGTSIYKDKLNSKISSSKLSISSNPNSDLIDCGYFITSDGYKAKNIKLIDKGKLKSHLLGIYGANKTGGKRVSNDGGAITISIGDKSFKNMIKDVNRGVLLCRFSGASPSDNGDFSGVAKNSFYIENGEIKYPITETMISGNIPDMINNIIDISSEQLNFGYCKLPWIAFDGLTIS